MNQTTEQNRDIAFKNITVKAKINGSQKTILDNVSGTIKQGSVQAVFGESGSGKTTLMHVICGIVQKSSSFSVEGEITVGGKLRDPVEWFKKIGLVRQEDLFNEEQTVFQCIETSARFFYETNNKKIINPICKKFLELLNIWEVRNTKIKVISGGQKKRLSIACVLIKEPETVFLDEPFSGLDTNNAINLANFLKYCSVNFGTTYIFSVHGGNIKVMEVADGSIYLCNGQLVFIGDNESLDTKFVKINAKQPEKMNRWNFLSTFSRTKHMYVNEGNNSVFLDKMLEITKQESSGITDGKGKFIHMKQLYQFIPSPSHTFTLIRRKIQMTFCQGFMKIFWKSMTFIPFFLLFLIIFLLKSSLKNYNWFSKGSEDSIKLSVHRDSIFINDSFFIYGIFSLLNSMMLGQIWSIMTTEAKIVNDELSMCKYNLMTYLSYVVIYSYCYTVFVTLVVCIPLLRLVLDFDSPFNVLFNWLTVISPLTLIVSFGISSLFSLMRYLHIYKFINQIAFIVLIYFIGKGTIVYLSKIVEKLGEIMGNLEPEKPEKGFFSYLKAYNVLIFFIPLSMYTIEYLVLAKDRIIQTSKPFIKESINSIPFTKEILTNYKVGADKFYHLFAITVTILFVTASVVQIYCRSPKYRL